MGSPRRFYLFALQAFAHALAYMDDPTLAKKLFEETSEERLRSFILQKKEQLPEKIFYYDAGRASQYVLEEADKAGCDPLNAAIGGIAEFEHFIGLSNDTDT